MFLWLTAPEASGPFVMIHDNGFEPFRMSQLQKRFLVEGGVDPVVSEHFLDSMRTAMSNQGGVPDYPIQSNNDYYKAFGDQVARFLFDGEDRETIKAALVEDFHAIVTVLGGNASQHARYREMLGLPPLTKVSLLACQQPCLA